jgi:hypothetical protein
MAQRTPNRAISSIFLGLLVIGLAASGWLVWTVLTGAIAGGEPVLGAVLLAPLGFVSAASWFLVAEGRGIRASDLVAAVVMGIASGTWVAVLLPAIGCPPRAEDGSLLPFSFVFGALTTVAIALAPVVGRMVPADRIAFRLQARLIAGAFGLVGSGTALFGAALFFLGPLTCIA